jgi:hypothetical protein
MDPCSERCPNWLLYGIQPEHAHRELVPGASLGKAHKRHTLGYAGRRRLVSRRWTGRTLDDYRDARANTSCARSARLAPCGARHRRRPRPHPLHLVARRTHDPDPPDRTELVLRAINQRRRWRAQYDRARSATGDLGPPAAVRAEGAA